MGSEDDPVSNAWRSALDANPQVRRAATYLLTYLPTYLLTHLLTYSLTHLLTYLLTYSLTHLLAHLLTHLLTYLLTYSLTYSLTYLPLRPLGPSTPAPTFSWPPVPEADAHQTHQPSDSPALRPM